MFSPFSLHLLWHMDLDTMVVVAHAHGGTVHGEKMSEVLWVDADKGLS